MLGNTLSIQAVQAGTEFGNKFKLADSTGVLHKDGTLTEKPALYDDADAALTAGEELLAVGEFYNGQQIIKSERIENRIELTFA